MSELKRGLKSRHIQLIALGGAIGTGLFLGIAQTIQMAGPSVLLGYGVAGLIAFFIMRQLGEMVVDEPVAGSFSYFADKYCGHWAGFMAGWNYWVLYVLVSMAELSAVGIYVQYWWPAVPTWVSALAFFAIINAISLFNVFRRDGILVRDHQGAGDRRHDRFRRLPADFRRRRPQASVANLWQHGGFFPNGVGGLVMAMAVIMFSFGGLELIGITAAEADNPSDTSQGHQPGHLPHPDFLHRRAGHPAVAVPGRKWSPAAAVRADLPCAEQQLVAHVLNVVVLTAALSVYNSGVYSTPACCTAWPTRQCAAIAAESQRARRAADGAGRVGAGHRHLRGGQLLHAGKAFGFLMGLVVSALIINWGLISGSTCASARTRKPRARPPQFQSLGYPLTNYLCLAFLPPSWW
jgi:aromatic amino acid transport protein AroP